MAAVAAARVPTPKVCTVRSARNCHAVLTGPTTVLSRQALRSTRRRSWHLAEERQPCSRRRQRLDRASLAALSLFADAVHCAALSAYACTGHVASLQPHSATLAWRLHPGSVLQATIAFTAAIIMGIGMARSRCGARRCLAASCSFGGGGWATLESSAFAVWATRTTAPVRAACPAPRAY